MGSLKHLSKSVLAGGLLGCAVAWSAPAVAHEEQSQPIIATEGRGEVSVEPDSFRVSVGAVARDTDLDKARRSVNAKIERIIEAVNSLKIYGLSLRTEILSVSPLYEPEPPTATPPPATPRGTSLRPIIGYEVTNSISVALRGASTADLGNQASRIIGAALGHGANNVGNVEFFLQNPAPAEDRALEAAVAAAKRKAEVIASATGSKIVKIQLVKEGFATYAVPEQSIGMGLSMGAGAPPGEVTRIETGKIVVNSNVTAQFVFEKQ